MVEDAPDDLVHEVFTQQFWARHPLGAADPRHAGDRRFVHLADNCADTSIAPIVAPNLVIAAAGHLEHAALRRPDRATRSPRCRQAALPRVTTLRP